MEKLANVNQYYYLLNKGSTKTFISSHEEMKIVHVTKLNVVVLWDNEDAHLDAKYGHFWCVF